MNKMHAQKIFPAKHGYIILFQYEINLLNRVKRSRKFSLTSMMY